MVPIADLLLSIFKTPKIQVDEMAAAIPADAPTEAVDVLALANEIAADREAITSPC